MTSHLWIRENLIFNLIKPSFAEIARDRKAEEEIARLSRAEYALTRYMLDTDKSLTSPSAKALKKEIQETKIKIFHIISCVSSTDFRVCAQFEQCMSSAFPWISSLCQHSSKAFDVILKEIGDVPINVDLLSNSLLNPVSDLSPKGRLYKFLGGNDGFPINFVLRAMYKDRKVFLPGFVGEVTYDRKQNPNITMPCTKFYFFQNAPKVEPLFNESLLPSRMMMQHSPAALGVEPRSAVILTDSLEYAMSNQSSRPQDSLVWISWDNRPGSIDRQNWAALKGRVVYYLLIAHSQLSTREIVTTAQEVQKKLKEIQVGRLMFVTYLKTLRINLPDSPAQNAVQPRLLNENQFQEEVNWQPQGLIREVLSSPIFRLPSTASTILTPVIKSQSTNLIFLEDLAQNYYQQSFVASISCAIASRSSVFDKWVAPEAVQVICLCDQNSLTGVSEQLRLAGNHFKLKTALVPIAITPIDNLNPQQKFEHLISMLPQIHAQAIKKVLVLEGLALPVFLRDQWLLAALREFLRQLQAGNWTIILTGGGICSSQAVDLGNELGLDSIVELNLHGSTKSQDPELKVRILKKPAGKLGNISPFTIQCRRESDSIEWRRPRQSPARRKGVFHEILQINKLMFEGLTSEAISIKLGMSEPLVKKRIQQMRGMTLRDPITQVKYTLERDNSTGMITIRSAWTKNQTVIIADKVLFPGFRRSGESN